MSYYIRGQYTLVDTLPLARRALKLFPEGDVYDGAAEEDSPERAGGNGLSTSPDAPTARPTPASPARRLSASILKTAAPAGKEHTLPPNISLPFSLEMPTNHVRSPNYDLPPSAQVYQVGTQVSVEYIFRVKVSRKWRMAET